MFALFCGRQRDFKAKTTAVFSKCSLRRIFQDNQQDDEIHIELKKRRKKKADCYLKA